MLAIARITAVQIYVWKIVKNFAIRCTPLSDRHRCYSLPARNTFSRFPNELPGGTSISSSSVETSFAFLQVGPPDPNCEAAFMHIICLASQPPCSNTTDLLLPVCPDSCLAFVRLLELGKCDLIIESSEQFLMSSTLEILQFLFVLLNEFDCRNASTYYFVDEVNFLLDSERCTDLMTPNQTRKTKTIKKRFFIYLCI